MSMNVLTNICAKSFRLTACSRHAFSNPRFITPLKKFLRFRSDFLVKVVGVPYSFTEDNVDKFFHGCNIVGGEKGVHLSTKNELKWKTKNRPAQVAFVELASQSDLEKVKTFSTQLMGERTIKIIETTEEELEWVINGKIVHNKTKHTIVMIGIPFSATKDDVKQFFSPHVPVGIRLFQGLGEGLVDFPTHADAVGAMEKHKMYMGERYVVLNLRSRIIKLEDTDNDMEWPAPT